MRSSPIANIKKYRRNTIILGVISFLGAALLSLALFSVIVAALSLNKEFMSVLANISLCIGCYALSFVIAKRKRRKGVKVGVLCGLAVFAFLLLGGFFVVKVFSFSGMTTKLCMIIISSAIGGVIGVNSPQNRV